MTTMHQLVFSLPANNYSSFSQLESQNNNNTQCCVICQCATAINRDPVSNYSHYYLNCNCTECAFHPICWRMYNCGYRTCPICRNELNITPTDDVIFNSWVDNVFPDLINDGMLVMTQIDRVCTMRRRILNDGSVSNVEPVGSRVEPIHPHRQLATISIMEEMRCEFKQEFASVSSYSIAFLIWSLFGLCCNAFVATLLINGLIDVSTLDPVVAAFSCSNVVHETCQAFSTALDLRIGVNRCIDKYLAIRERRDRGGWISAVYMIYMAMILVHSMDSILLIIYYVQGYLNDGPSSTRIAFIIIVTARIVLTCATFLRLVIHLVVKRCRRGRTILH